MIFPRSTATNVSPTSYSRQAPDQDSMRPNLQLYLDQLRDKLDCVCREMLEIRSRIAELASSLSEVTMGDEGARDTDLCLDVNAADESPATAPVAPNELNITSPWFTQPDPLFPQPRLHGTCFTESLPEGAYPILPSVTKYDQTHCPPTPPVPPTVSPMYNPPCMSMACTLRSRPFQNSVTRLLWNHCQRVHVLPSVNHVRSDPLPSSTSDSANYELTARYLQPHYGASTEGHALPSSSARHNKQASLLVAQSRQGKVKCSWPGCLIVVNKDNLTRHVKEIHEQKDKVVCAGCRKQFTRLCTMKAHMRRAKCGSSQTLLM